MDTIKITSISAQEFSLVIEYEITETLSSYFSKTRVFQATYSENISTVPNSILVIPFICNILPIIWITNSTLIVPELDENFYQCIPNLRNAYQNMSPMFNFLGNIHVNKLINNNYTTTDKTAALFSGGVDAFATLVAHATEKPTLITLWGADIDINNTEGWKHVQEHLETIRQDFDLPYPITVQSNFRAILYEGALNRLVRASNTGWWYGYQHGIGLLGHGAPLAYLHRWKTLYIASSNTIEEKEICASDPSIDNQLMLCSTHIWHDLYDYHRQQKIRSILTYSAEQKIHPHLRVCWVSTGGTNCCTCEKCRRTIFSLLAENENPAKFGFPDWEDGVHNSCKYLKKHCRCNPGLRKTYTEIQNRFKETLAYQANPDINWIYQANFSLGLNLMERISAYIRRQRRKLKKLFTKKR